MSGQSSRIGNRPLFLPSRGGQEGQAAAQRAAAAAAAAYAAMRARNRSKPLKRPQMVVVRENGKGGSSAGFSSSYPDSSVSVASSYAGSPLPPSRPNVSSSIAKGGDCRIRVRHMEYIQDVPAPSGSGAFQLTSIPVNPGFATTFPWLQALANNFESYKFHRLVFHFRTEASSATVGKVILVVDFDASDTAPVNKAGLLANRVKGDGAPWQTFAVRCDSQDLNKFGPQRFVRSTALAANLDIKTYDVANLYIATQGFATTATPGEVWVEYDVELMTPDINTSLESEKIVGSTAISSTSPFGTAPIVTGVPVATPSGQNITFADGGQFLVDLLLTGTGLTAPTVSATNAAATLLDSVINSAATSGLYQLIVNASPGGVLSFVNNATTVTAAVGRVAPYLNSLA
jgi:hypothetical protein